MRDHDTDPLIMCQHRHFGKIVFVLWMASALVPCLYWNESFIISLVTCLMGSVIASHQSVSVNSIAHSYGYKPYDTRIEATFSRLVSYLTLGEGYHNFHHSFPKDYSQCEVKWTTNFNVTALFIDCLDYMGLVSFKYVTNPDSIQKQRSKNGD